jgi:ABC-type glycerol-3-phosphate transport system permease component
MTNNRIKSVKDLIRILFNGIVTVLIFVVTVFPFYWLIVSSVKPEKELYASTPTLFPHQFTGENFINVIQRSSLPRYFLNSIVNVTFTLLIVIVVASLASYSISRYKFRGKKYFFLGILLAQIMPVTTIIIPLYITWSKLGRLNTYFSIIATYTALFIPVAIWLLCGYFNSIPRSLDEAATIDGCSGPGILFKIVLPLAKPGVMAASLSIIISVWQELMLAMTFTTKDEMRPLMSGVNAFITKSGIQWGPLNASGILTCIPIILIFLFFRKALVQGLTSGSVKG